MRKISEAKHCDLTSILAYFLVESESGRLLQLIERLRFKMPSSCCAINCTNRSHKDSPFVFYSFPSEKKNPKRRELWINAVKREKWTEHQINNARLCSQHFISGKKSQDPTNPDYVPTIFSHKKSSPTKNTQKLERHSRYLKRKHCNSPMSDVSDELDMSAVNDGNQESDAKKIQRLEAEVSHFRSENCKLVSELKETKELLAAAQNDSLHRMNETINLRSSLKKAKKKSFRYNKVKKSKKMHTFYTGLSLEVFEWLLSNMKTIAKRFCKKLNYADHLLIVIMKLRLGLKNKDLAYRFDITFGTVSRIFRTWIKALSKLMSENIIIWPEKPALRQHLPKCFRKCYRKCVCIIDCTEIFIERPLNLNARAQTWSNYKHHNTIKYLIACTPTGAVSFVSDGWGGRVSDKEITIKSGFLELIETGDQILADRGFTVEQEVATKGGILEIPSFTKGKSQLSAGEVDVSRQIANVRIHIERVIGRLRKFNILNTLIPISQVDLLDDVVVSVAGLVNLCQKIVGS